jgi:predicted nucleic acid-binding protein
VTLCDAGPLVAIVDRADAQHARCLATLETLPAGGLMMTWACLAEAMYLLGRKLGWRAQDEVWSYVSDGLLRLYTPAEGEWQRMRVLMRDYADTPMDLADASLVAAAETLRQRRVFTVDKHFYVYRQRQGHAFEVVP